MRMVIVLVVVCCGCISSSSVECDGVVCPAGTVCRELQNPTQSICATPGEIAACSGIADGLACTLDGTSTASCVNGTCLPTVCGDNRIEPGEACDDGNTVTGDGCSGDCTSNELCGNGHVDPLTISTGGPILNEECDDGNRASGDGCSSNCKLETPQWTQLALTPPIALEGPAMAYDSDRGRVVMFGGIYTDPITTKNTSQSTTYQWDGTAWRSIPTLISPGPRARAGMAYDSARHRTVMFGGQITNDDGGALGDLWEWDGSVWHSIPASGGPTPRTEFGMVYDSARKVTVIFGGFSHDQLALNETWEWNGVIWKQVVTPTLPTGRFDLAMAYDPSRAVTVMAGGEHDGTNPTTPDTWEYDGTDWHVTGSAPADLDFTSMAYDPVNRRMIAYGGRTGDNGPIVTKTYAYANGTWSELVGQTTPGPHYFAGMASDLARGQIVMFGGIEDELSPATISSDTWIWHGSSWTKAAVSPVPTTALLMASCAYDPVDAELWCFGGAAAAGLSSPTNELWSFTNEWKQHTIAGGPSAREGAAFVYDPQRHVFVLFSGIIDGSSDPGPADTWLFDRTTWTQVTPAHSPSARGLTTFVFDPVRGVDVLYGGIGVGNAILGDQWTWNGTDWQEVSATALPQTRAAAGATFDTRRGVMLMSFGAQDDVIATHNDLWAWDGTSWTELSNPTPATDRFFAPMFYIPGLDRTIMFGGLEVTGASLADTWQWDGTSWTQVFALQAPSSRGATINFPGDNGVDMLMFGGTTEFDGGTRFPELWRFRYDDYSPRESCSIAADIDGDGLVGCADPDCAQTCATCGDGVCDTRENCRNCPQDCTCTSVCGDGFCDSGETHAMCPGDCP